MFEHLPIMPQEILTLLAIQPGSVVVDATAGGGGHLRLLAKATGPGGKVIGLDQDPRAHAKDAAGGVADEFQHVRLHQNRFSELSRILKSEGIDTVDALLCDLGVSSPQLDTPERGFSFRSDGPIDMRMNPDSGISAYDLILESSESELADIIYQYGEERLSRRIARALKAEKSLPNSTLALANLIAKSMRVPRGRIHPATRTFQALRIAVNQELGELDQLLVDIDRLTHAGSRVAFLSFHSLEDRRIKHHFRDQRQSWKVLTKKPVTASESEINLNPRAQSAKLRVGERI